MTATRSRVARVLPLLPATLLLLGFLAGPVLWAVYASFTDVAFTGPAAVNPSFVGLENYAHLLRSDAFGHAVLLTVAFVVGSAIIGQNVVGLGLALLLERAPRGVGTVVTGIVMLGWVLPEIVAAFTMVAFFRRGGTLDTLAAPLGLPGENWLYLVPLGTVILANIWRGSAFSLLAYRAALRTIPASVLDAAAIDGAGTWARMRHVQLPLLRGPMLTNTLLITMQTLGVFTLIFVLTGGGPAGATQTLPLLAYDEGFTAQRIGYGTAIAVVTLALGGVIAGVSTALARRGRP